MRTGARSPARALERVLAALSDLGVPAQAVGGLACRAWGGGRDLVDLDFYVPERALARVEAAVPDWIRAPAGPVAAEHWELRVLPLEVEQWRVELGGAEGARYRRGPGAPWHDAAVGFERSTPRTAFGVDVPVMPLEELVRYKRVLDREVDQVDLHELTGNGGAVACRLAVYGTLAPGEANHAVVADLPGRWSRGIVHGERSEVGWGMTHGFPALRWRPDGPAVPVHLLVSEGLPAAWERLDTFEGSAYRRILVPVTTDEGRILANIYVAGNDP